MLVAIILAAGQSRRMGTQKLLLPWAGQTMIGNVVDQVLNSSIENVIVVVSGSVQSSSQAASSQDFSADARAIAQALAGKPIELVVNPDPAAEMLSSIRCGLRALPADCTAALVALGDQPNIRAELIDKLIAAHQASPEQIVAPVYSGKRGHPMILPARFFAEVLAQYETVGLHGLLETHAAEVLKIEAADRSIIDDIDTPDDYRRAMHINQTQLR